MAYNLYQVQMAKAWTERVKKEAALAEKFWDSQTGKFVHELDNDSEASASTSTSMKTTYLRSKLEDLEKELVKEREARCILEKELGVLKASCNSQR